MPISEEYVTGGGSQDSNQIMPSPADCVPNEINVSFLNESSEDIMLNIIRQTDNIVNNNEIDKDAKVAILA